MTKIVFLWGNTMYLNFNNAIETRKQYSILTKRKRFLSHKISELNSKIRELGTLTDYGKWTQTDVDSMVFNYQLDKYTLKYELSDIEKELVGLEQEINRITNLILRGENGK